MADLPSPQKTLSNYALGKLHPVSSDASIELGQFANHLSQAASEILPVQMKPV